MRRSIIAGDIMTSGSCNMDCRYCYIPKAKELNKIHKDIECVLKNNEYIPILKEVYGDDLEILGFWGTEPTLTLDLITNNLELYIINFPKLKEFSFSSNMLFNTETIHRFIEKCDKLHKNHNREIKVKVQISLDGPECITDNNRKDGATRIIVDNYKKLIDFLIKLNPTVLVEVNFKPTMGTDIIKQFNDNNKLFEEYFSFFDELLDYQKLIISTVNNVEVLPALAPTLVVPGDYSSDDGVEFSKYINNLFNYNQHIIRTNCHNNIHGNINGYCYRLSSIFLSHNEINKSLRSFTCSAGDSNTAVDRFGNRHLCHRTFYMNEDAYVKEVLESKDTDNWDMAIFANLKYEQLRRQVILNVDQDDSAFFTRMYGFHHFYNLKISYIESMLYEMISTDQASKIYAKNKTLSYLFSLFVTTSFGCPVENLINTCSLHFPPISTLRIWCNGAFEELLKYYIKLEVLHNEQ